MKVEIIYDGACPFCNDYVRYQRLAAVTEAVQLVDARTHPEVLSAHGIAAGDLEDGMVVIIDGTPYKGADAVHQLSKLSEPPRRAWVRVIAWLSQTAGGARFLYPILKRGRRVALAALGISRFPRD